MKPGRHESDAEFKKFRIGSHVNDLSEFDFYNQFLGGSLFREQTGKTLKHVALVVKKSVLQALNNSFPNAWKQGFHYIGNGQGRKKRDRSTRKTYDDTMKDAVRVTKLKGGANHQELKVHILGTRKKGSGTYRLRFYEAGGPRKKRGSIPGHQFFYRGHNSVNVWETVKENLNAYLKQYGWL